MSQSFTATVNRKRKSSRRMWRYSLIPIIFVTGMLIICIELFTDLTINKSIPIDSIEQVQVKASIWPTQYWNAKSVEPEELVSQKVEISNISTNIPFSFVQTKLNNNPAFTPNYNMNLEVSDLSLKWESVANIDTTDMSWADWDNDGDLDFAVSTWRNRVFMYENTGQDFDLFWTSPANEATTDIEWGDWDNDGDLDFAVSVSRCAYINCGGDSDIYENQDGVFEIVWSSGFIDATSLDWGDFDNDGDLDLAIGYANLVGALGPQPNRIYENDDGVFSLHWSSSEVDYTMSIDWGDWDNDGDLDLAVGNHGANRVYENENGNVTLAWTSIETDTTNSVAWGDGDNDGDLDLAVGNSGQPNRLYTNTGGNLTLTWSSPETDYTNDVEWGDGDSDGDLDLAVGNNGQPNRVYENIGQDFILSWSSTDSDNTASVNWGDVDNDGDLDLALGKRGAGNQIYENPKPHFEYFWASSEEYVTSLSIGDWDGDGDEDLAVGKSGYYDWDLEEFIALPNHVYENVGNDFVLAWTSSELQPTSSLAWGDWDNDGDLDLAVGNGGGNMDIYSPLQVYENNGITLNLAWSSEWTEWHPVSSLDWGDWDSDGDLDLAVGYGGAGSIPHCYSNRIYENVGESLSLTWIFPAMDCTTDLTWGDWDNDGDPDLAVSNLAMYGHSNYVYENEGGEMTIAWSGSPFEHTQSMDWGDWDNDGDLDLAEGNSNAPHHIYSNSGEGLNLSWISAENTSTSGIAWGDRDRDGDIDVALSGRIYDNVGNDLALIESLNLPSSHVEWGDMDNDGDLDIAMFIPNSQVLMFKNNALDNPRLSNTPSKVIINFPDGRSARVLESFGPTLPITYTLYDPEGDPVREVKAYYSLNGYYWQPAVATSETITYNLSTSANGEPHVFFWDILESNFFGSSDNVTFRLDILQSQSGTGPFQRTIRSMQTPPFRLRGSQVRVVDDSTPEPVPQSGSIVYRQPTAAVEFVPYQDKAGQPFYTNPAGYLQGYGEISPDDQLVALLPISATQDYTIYHTSAAPTASGLDAYTVAAGGVQTLTVSADNTLILFNLLLSIEWDARQDTVFMEQLEHDIQRTSELLYDITNGQAALGQVHIYHDRGHWGQAHVVIPASNSIRPSAILGGSVLTPTHDIGVTGVITNAYIPGQVRMPPAWNRFGDPNGTLGEDWPRTLAHELSHYLFFQPDNYLGLSDNGLLQLVECPGSVMTDPYIYDEFLTAAQWNDPQHTVCQQTLAQQYLGRSDWETVESFYNMLNVTGTNSGPTLLPLAVTQILTFAPPITTTALAAPFFRLVDESNSPAPIPEGRAQAYLIKTRNPLIVTDDYIIAEGVPVGDIVQARGTAPGDRLCVYDFSQAPLRLGCQTVGNVATPVMLHELPGWAPQVHITAIATDTVAVTVTNASESNLMVQLIPASGTASTEVAMVQATDAFTQTLVGPDGAYYGYVRVWVPGSNPLREIIVAYVGIDNWPGRSYAWGAPDDYNWGNPGDGWGGRSYAWGGRSYAWGGRSYAWGAPALSNDGQVGVYPLENLFGESSGIVLQQLPLPPALDSWLTPVGQAYRLEMGQPVSATAAILFNYLARDVPAGYENILRIYYSPDDGESWERLPTELDTYHNHASAQVEGDGIYVLVATVEIAPGFQAGWNNFGYPIQGTRPITQALASVEGKYTAVANYDPNRAEPWQTYYVTVTAPFSSSVNALSELEFTRAYWLYATEAITLYVAPRNSPELPLTGLQLPPATFYGWITPTAGFLPTVGMSVTAWIGEALCGESPVQEMGNGQLGYVLQVSSENIYGDPNGCGELDKTVRFHVGDWVMNHDHVWENKVAHYHSLTQPFAPVSGLTASNSSPTPFAFATVLTATIAAGDAVSYTWDLGDGSPLVNNAVVTHTYQAMGVYTATVTASNPANSLTATTVVEILNIAPTAVADQFTTAEDVPIAVSVPGVLVNDSDVNGDELTAVLIEEPGNGTLTLNLDGSFVYTPTQDFNGLDTFHYMVSDGVLTDAATVTISVSAVNDPPVVNVGDDLNVAEGELVSFSGQFSDVDNLPGSATIRWELGDGTIISGTVSPTHRYADDGRFLVTLTITDAAGGVGSDALEVIVVNVAPEVNAGEDLTVMVGTAVTFNGAFDDPGAGDTHAIEWDFGDGETASTTLTPTHSYTTPGTYIVILTVTDDDGGETSNVLVVMVKPYSVFLSIVVR